MNEPSNLLLWIALAIVALTMATVITYEARQYRQWRRRQ